MHTGVSPLGGRQLIQHLRTYYLSCVHNLIHDLSNHPQWTIGEAFEHRRELEELLNKRLVSFQTRPFPKEALLDPELLLFATNGDPAWSNEKLNEKHQNK
jgi:hypothetical protein